MGQKADPRRAYTHVVIILMIFSKLTSDFCDNIVKGKVKVKVKLSLCFTKYHAMKTYGGVED